MMRLKEKIVKRIAGSNGPSMSPEQFVDQCLDLMGPIEMTDVTKTELVAQAQSEGPLSWVESDYDTSAQRTGDMLALIAATREYQFG